MLLVYKNSTWLFHGCSLAGGRMPKNKNKKNPGSPSYTLEHVCQPTTTTTNKLPNGIQYVKGPVAELVCVVPEKTQAYK